MNPIIVNFHPYCFERLQSIRNRRATDLAMGLTAIPRKQKKAEAKAKTKRVSKPKVKKSPTVLITGKALESLNAMPEDQRKQMMEIINGTWKK